MKLKVHINEKSLRTEKAWAECPIVHTLADAAALLEAAGFEGCSVWRYDARAKHWRLIFDTSLPDKSRLPGRVYWGNVAADESSKP